MQYGPFTLIPVITLIWVCLLILIRIVFTPTTSIQVNMSDQKNLLTKFDFGGGKSATKTTEAISGGSFQKGKRKYHVPRFMLELYEKNKEGGSPNCSRPDIVRSLIPRHAGPANHMVIEELADNHLLIFDLPTSNEEEKFVSAELKILTLIEINSNAVSGVERLLKISVYDDITKNLYHLQKIHVYHLNNTWLSFNLTKPVVDILAENRNKDHDRYLKIVISVSDFLPYFQKADNSFKLSLMPIIDNFEHDYPILLLSYNSSESGDKKSRNDETAGPNKAIRRSKRSLEEDYEEETNRVWDSSNDVESLKKIQQMRKLKRLKNVCRRRSLYINFAEIEYDLWIVQPPGYEAFQCQGKCFYPVAEHLNPTKHAIVQALLHSVSPAKASRSCCVPTILDSISILYVDSSGVLTYRYAYKDMVVLECGCR